LHFLTTLLVFFVLLELRYSRKKSLAAALIFATHPVLVQAIGWIPGLNDVILGFFVFLSFFAFLKFVSSNAGWWCFLHIFSFLIALLSKESALMLPLLCLFYLLFVQRERILSNKTLVLAIGWLGSIIIWVFLRSTALGNSFGYGIKETLQSLLSGIHAFIPYIGKLLFPLHLSVLPIMKDLPFLPGLIGIAILALLVIIRKKNTRLMWFGITWLVFFIFLSLIQPGVNPPVFHEHRLYVPLLGFLILGLEIAPAFSNEEKRKALQKVAISIILIFSILSILRLPIFEGRLAFWHNAVATSPNSAFSHNNLGAMYYLDGNITAAEIEFKKALELNPLEPLAHNNIGLIHMAYGDFKNARSEFLKELEINPTYDDARKNLDLLSQKEK
ncbi:MAG: glycosyltransferase family 39 protein, partial [Candidatus Jorgensenbacteria bacterium]